MADIAGFTLILLIFFITFLLTIRYPKVSKILYFALCIRVFTLLIGHYLITLPDSTRDANSFADYALLLSQDGFIGVIEKYPGPSARFISWFVAIFYSLFGESVLMAKSITLIFGVSSVFLSWKLANKLWGYKIASRIGWTMALFPSLILYSALVMREAYVCFFLIVAIYGIVDWSKTKKVKSIVISMLGFYCSTFFHGATALGGIVFIVIIIVVITKDFINSSKYFRLRLIDLVLLIFFSYIVVLFVSNQISIPYIENFDYITDLEIILRKSNIGISGNASYPEWTILKTEIEILYKIPIKSLYFLFAPFPWDIKSTKHLIGVFDGFLYLILITIILKNIKEIWQNPTLRIILLMLIIYIAAFSVGVGNFGTGIRHRSKFAFMFIFLAVPFINNFVFFKKNRLKI